MNWVYEGIIFVATMGLFFILIRCGVNWSDYPWWLVGVCACVVAINMTSYRQGMAKGSELTRKAWIEATEENMEATYKVLYDIAKETAQGK